MNIIEAYNQAKVGQKIVHVKYPKAEYVKRDYDLDDMLVWLRSVCGNGAVLTDFWEVAKEVKTFEAEVTWEEDEEKGFFVHGFSVNNGRWSEINKKTGKLVFTWEE